MANIYTQPSLTGGMDNSLVEVVSTVSSFVPGFLMFVFGVILLGGMATQKRRTGYADAQMWTVMAAMSTLMISLLLTLKEGLINLDTLGIVVAINVFAALWLFLNKGRGEF